jgi:hypothetical protein
MLPGGTGVVPASREKMLAVVAIIVGSPKRP